MAPSVMDLLLRSDEWLIDGTFTWVSLRHVFTAMDQIYWKAAR